MPRVEFESDTLEELVRMAQRWVAGYPEGAADRAASQEPPPETLEDVLRRIKSAASQHFLRAVAERPGEEAPFKERMAALRTRHARKSSFLERLDLAKLP